MLPISAIVVGNAGWIGKAISIVNPDLVPPNTSPDQIFVVVANIVALPGVFGFIMAALTAALMSTVDTLINATAAIYINDIHRPIKLWLKSSDKDLKKEDKKELFSARVASIIITALGVLSVLVFEGFPTVYEAHGFFHSTLTPPLVVAIFLGIFWKRFTPAAVIASFLGGVALMIMGANHPHLLIAPFAQGIEMHKVHPYSYIRALYNLVVCSVVAVSVVYANSWLKNTVATLKARENHKQIFTFVTSIAGILFVGLIFSSSIVETHPDSYLEIAILLFLTAILVILVALSVTYYVKYDEEKQTLGLTAWSIAKAKEMFKGSKINDEEGKSVVVKWKIKDGEDDTVNFSTADMEKMKANAGDLVYLTDKRKWLGGLKSIHSVFGEPHDEDGIVYATQDHVEQGQFIKGKLLLAEKEM
jgi:SSS family solute:Na+ symporter